MNDQFQWLVDNRAAWNLQGVASLGDITDGAGTGEFATAKAAYDKLKAANIPFTLAVGNHDYSSLPSRSLTNYDATFGPSYFTGLSWYGSTSYPTGSNANHYAFFDIAGTKYMLMALEFYPRTGAVLWAQGILSANQDRLTIVTTHAYLTPQSGPVHRVLDNDTYGPAGYGLPSADYNGQELWDNLIKNNGNVTVVANGHFMDGPYHAHQTSLNDFGKPVNEVFSDYQSEGGYAYITLLKFRPSLAKIEVYNYSVYSSSYDPNFPMYTVPFDTANMGTGIFGRTSAYAKRSGFSISPNIGSPSFTITIPENWKGAGAAAYDLAGRRVLNIGRETEMQITWNTANVPDGIYIVRLQLNGQAMEKRVAVVK